MLATVNSCAVIGLDGVVVEVEVDTGGGLPKMVIVGLPDAAVQESRERVQSAVKNAGFYYPRRKVTVNLAPASVRKEGPAYDLPIAVGVLIATEQLEPDAVADTLIIGELSLDGGVRHVKGVLPMAALARQEGYKTVIVPEVDAPEAALIPDIKVIPAPTLNALYDHLTGMKVLDPADPPDHHPDEVLVETDFSEIKGQEHVKRALEVAAAGGHNLLMIGPPGAGKTLMARALPSILPAMTIDEALDVTRIYSVADLLPSDVPLIRARPFRAPHHTISHAGLVGGGNWPHPGEISLAHRGVLFLDELPEFSSKVLEVLRQPLEDKVVTISRAQGSLTFPGEFPTGGGDESLSLRVLRRSHTPLYLLFHHGHPLPEADFRPLDGPDRYSHAGAAGGIPEIAGYAAGGKFRNRAGEGGGCPGKAADTVRGNRDCQQRGYASGTDSEILRFG